MELKIMSFNIRYACDTGTEAWDERFKNLVPLVKDADPDLIGFQEVLPNQYHDLKEQFSSYKSVGAGRDDGMDKGERSAIFYNEKRFTHLDSGTFWLSETPDRPSLGWDAVCLRICTYAKLFDNRTHKQFIHFNTHLDHAGEQAKVEGAKLILKTMLADKTPSFVTGDFNMEERSEPYKILTSCELADAKYSAKLSMSHGTFHGFVPDNDISEESPIDYLFYRKGKFGINSYKVLVNGSKGRYTSDHYPILIGLFQL